MPFTPFHFGVGAVLKAVAPTRFSLSVFCFSQVVADTEVLVYMAKGGKQWHGFFHTYVGAAVVALFSIVAGRPICQKALRLWSAEPHVPLKQQYGFSPEISIGSAVAGAIVGSFSHVALDSVMHSDLRPFRPFNDSNDLFGLVSPGLLHLICFALGVIGILVCAWIPNKKL